MRLRNLAVVAALTLGLLAACGPDDNPSGNPGSDGNNTATTSNGNNTATTSSGNNTATTSSGGGGYN